MKKIFVNQLGSVLTAFALFVTTWNANVTCAFVAHQPKLPEAAKGLRRF